MVVKTAYESRIYPISAVEQAILDEDTSREKYLRGAPADVEALQDKKLKGQIKTREHLYGKSATTAAKSEKYLLPGEGGILEAEDIERTERIRQEAIGEEVDLLSKRNQYDLVLPELGPYTMDITSNGRYMVASGRKGHLALMDMRNLNIVKEFQVNETVRDVAFLHNQKLFVAAQKKYVYMYNDSGTEVHCLKEHGAASKLRFLYKHFLLTSINKYGQLHYQDITTGTMIGNFRTGLGRSDEMQVNRYNNVVATGHAGGTVSMWKPTVAAPLVKMLCHKGPVTAMAFHSNGHLMATAGMDKKIKIWDLRKYEAVQTLPYHAKSLDFSKKGLLASANGSFVQVHGDFSGGQDYSQYMTHPMVKGYQIKKVLFRPYEDVLAIGHSKGWSSILIPGSGEPNFDTFEDNPFETLKQRNEKEVHALLDKLPPETIMLNPTTIGSVRTSKKKGGKPTKEERNAELEAAKEAGKSVTLKKKTKGRSKPSKVAKKKEENVANAKKGILEQEAKELELGKKKRKRIVEEEIELPKSLQRFAKKVLTE